MQYSGLDFIDQWDAKLARPSTCHATGYNLAAQALFKLTLRRRDEDPSHAVVTAVQAQVPDLR